MYKVFIDNKTIVFSSKMKKISKYADSVIVNLSEIAVADVVGLRNTLPEEVTVIVVDNDPDASIRKVFAGYDFVEAAGGIVKRKNKYLFIERFGKWDLPKGKMEAGEKPAFTAEREIEEECGIEGAKAEELIGITFHTYEFKGKPTLKKNWWYRLSYDGTKNLVPQTEESITQAVWLKREEIKRIKKNTYASIIEVLDLYEHNVAMF